MTQAPTADSAALADQENAAPHGSTTAGDDRDARPDAAGSGSGIAAIVRRRLAPFDARLDPYSWLVTAVITLIAGILRFVILSHPPGKIFDETYYATDAHWLMQKGVEWNPQENGPAYVVHPPLGKWLIGLGEGMFGYNELGWRVSAAVVGTLSVLLLVRIGRRLFGSTTLGATAGLLMALDGMHLVMSRVALLDIFLMFFVLASFGALVLDRDARRRRWLREMENGLDPSRPGRAGRPAFRWPDAVPWWRLAAAVLLGCAMAVKWSALWYIMVFGALVILWEAGTRRSAGVRRPWRDTILDETGWLLLCFGLIGATYLASWSGWLLTDDGYYRHWLADNGQRELPVLGALQNLWHYHVEAYRFHTGLHVKHAYQSWPWQWLMLGRPVAFYWNTEGPCGADNCASEVLLLGTPVLWWSFLPALAALTWFGIARRDWRTLAIWAGVFAGIGPWFWFAVADSRTMFYFYALPSEPFLVLAVVYVLGAIIRPARGEPSPQRRLIGTAVAGAYVVAVAVCFAYFYPIYVGESIPYAQWSARMWLGGRWI